MLPMLRDSASFFKKDSRQAGMTTLKNYVNLLNAFILVIELLPITNNIFYFTLSTARKAS